MGNIGFVESCETRTLQKTVAANGVTAGSSCPNSTIKTA
jgi:hypothetical protein